jgi:hypothetical protein
MNVPFCLWLASLRDAQLWVMFHEVRVPWFRRPDLFTVGVAQRVMASLLMARADRVFYSVPAWIPLLRRVAVRWPEAGWLPIPSNLPTEVPAGAAEAVRHKLGLGSDDVLLGHFSTYGRLISPPLKEVALRLLAAHPRRRLLLLGRGGPAFARGLGAGNAGRVTATGELPPMELATHLAACDLLLQPYVDGVSSRRTTVMAGLALGVPIATNEGWTSEAVWRESAGVAIARDPGGIGDLAEALLSDPAGAIATGHRGRALYRERFSFDNTLRVLRAGATEGQ